MSKLKLLSAGLIAATLIATTPIVANAASKNSLTFSVIKQQLNFTKNDIQSVKLLPGGKNFGVEIILTSKATKELNQLTAMNINQKLQISVGDRIANQATIQSSLGAKFIIMTSQEAAQKLLRDLS